MERDHGTLLENSLDGLHLELLHLFANQAVASQTRLYLVGGVVRDLFLGRAIKDFDLVVEGDISDFAESILKKYGGKIIVHPRFGTAKWILNESTFRRLEFPVSRFPDFELSFDLVTARSESYTQPGALPIVERSMIEDDLRRRDFTINAMALRLDGNHYGKLLDPLGGEADLERGTIRVIHPKSFIDDPTRIYRAVRYEGRYDFQMDDATLALIPDAKSIITKLSAERLRHELDLILAEQNSASMLERLAELDLLRPIHPALFFDESANARLSNMQSFRALRRISPWNLDRGESNMHVLGWLLWLMTLSHNDIGSLNVRLQFTSDFLASLFAASTMFSNLDSFTEIKPSQFVERVGLYPLNAVEAVYFIAHDEKLKDIFFKYLSEWRHIKPHITGDDLQAHGLEPGPKYGEILRRLRAAWLDGEINSKEQESKLLNELL